MPLWPRRTYTEQTLPQRRLATQATACYDRGIGRTGHSKIFSQDLTQDVLQACTGQLSSDTLAQLLSAAELAGMEYIEIPWTTGAAEAAEDAGIDFAMLQSQIDLAKVSGTACRVDATRLARKGTGGRLVAPQRQ